MCGIHLWYTCNKVGLSDFQIAVMPLYTGRPNGPFLSSKNDSTNKWTICDLWLCRLDSRVPSATVSDNVDTHHVPIPAAVDSGSDDAAQIASPQAVRNELLCFIQQKTNLMAVDHVVKLCSEFYANDEIMGAKSILDKFVKHTLPRRQGGNASSRITPKLIHRNGHKLNLYART
jgi:hypothetical protein